LLRVGERIPELSYDEPAEGAYVIRVLSMAAIALATNAILAGQAATAPRLLVDGHVHITNRVYWEGIDPWEPQLIGAWDYARARQGGINVVIENIAPYGYSTYNTTVKQAGRLIETFHRVVEANPDKMELALTSADVRRIVASGKLAVILGIESGFDQEGDLDILRLWYRLGVRLIQFSSQVTNAYADSSIRGEAKWGGINERQSTLLRLGAKAWRIFIGASGYSSGGAFVDPLSEPRLR
jgi:membrane dipeptidase